MRLAPESTLVGIPLSFANSFDEPSGSTIGPYGGSKMVLGLTMGASMTDGLDTTANVPNWGACEVMLVRYASATVINPGRLVTIDKNLTIADLANTANLAQTFYVTLSRFTAGDVTAQWGWVLLSGIAPVQFAVAATAGAAYIGGAGQATPTQANGKQLVGLRTLIAASGSFTRTVITQANNSSVRISGTNGVFVGQAVSGTGIPSSSVVSAIDPSGQFITIGSAVGTPVNATATGTVTGTFTHTGFGICQFNRPFAQGQVV